MVGGYTRTSTGQQDLEAQRNSLLRWAEREGHQLRVYEDGAVKGTKTHRTGLDALLEAARGREIVDLVAVWELSRLGRSIGVIHRVVEELSSLGIKIVLTSSGTTLDYRTMEGRALIAALAMAADIEHALICERNARGREKIKRDKIKVGRKPLTDGKLSVEAVLNFHKQGMSQRAIAVLLKTSAPTICRILKNSKLPI